MFNDSRKTSSVPEAKGDRVSRRSFMGSALFASAAAAVFHTASFLEGRGWLEAATAGPPDLISDTFNGLFAFVVPGSDAYSVAQGASPPQLGGVDAGVLDSFLATLDATTPFVPAFSATVAGALNGIAQLVNPAAGGPFISPFARLSFAEKAAVFRFMDATESLALLGSLLPAFVAYFCYSEAGVFDGVTRTLTAPPLGWELSNYSGVSDGRNEFLGYLNNQRSVKEG